MKIVFLISKFSTVVFLNLDWLDQGIILDPDCTLSMAIGHTEGENAYGQRR
jgi:hypothetical protein